MDSNLNSGKPFPISLSVGWAVNLIGWVLFVVTDNHNIEFLTGLAALGCVFVAYKHKGTKEVAFGQERLTVQNLGYSSMFEAAWMFFWAFS